MIDFPQIIILAAGKGSRMNSVLPKPLHCVGGRPMLCHVLEAAESLNPSGIRIVIAPDDALTSDIVAPISTVIQPIARGTGDAVKHALDDINQQDGTALVLYGDAPLIQPETLARLVAEHEAGGHAATVLAFETPEPGAYGRLVMDEESCLRKIVEAKDATSEELDIRLCNGGIMAMDLSKARILIDALRDDNAAGELYLTDVISDAVSRGWTCGAVVTDETETLGANDRVELARLEQLFQKRKRRKIMLGGVALIDPSSVTFSWDTTIEPDVTIEPNVVFGPGVYIKSGATIRAFSYLEHAVVSERAIIGPYARLRPGTRIGEAAKIGNFVEIKNSDISAGAKIPHLSYIGDTEVGPRANIGAGTITCNYDGFAKHRTRIGADAFIGSNTALVAPVDVGPEAIVGAGSTVTRDIPSQALVIVRGEETFKPLGGAAIRNRKSKSASHAACGV